MPSVPVEMLLALVVSVVAEVARPDTAPAAMAMAVLVAEVTCPWALIAITGTWDAEP